MRDHGEGDMMAPASNRLQRASSAPKKTATKRARDELAHPPHDLVLHVSLRNIRPLIWRRLLVPGELTLHQLHRVLQLVFGWQDYHLYLFEVGGQRFEKPDPEAEGESSRAAALASLGLEAGDRFLYRYDFGDDWEHEIRVERVLPRAADEEISLPALLDGARAGPPEDCGGVGGYLGLVDALARPRSHACREVREWVGPEYDPAVFDRWMVGRMLALAAAWGAL